MNVQKPNEIKEKIKTFDNKSQKKKKRSQMVMKALEDCNKIQYNTKSGKRYYYKKNWFFISELKMSWFKKVFSSQSSSQGSSVTYKKETKTDQTDMKQDEKITERKFKMDDERQETEESSQSSQNIWWSSWSVLSTQFSSQKREHSDDENEEWWSWFCSTPIKKEEKNNTEPMDIPLTQTAIDRDNNKKNKKEDNDNEEGKAKFFVWVGKHKRFKYF